MQKVNKEDLTDIYKNNAKKAGGFFNEFREFILKGNVMDMAVGIIIGAAFKAIVDSLVNDILMPCIGIFAGEESFSNLKVNVGGAVITYGNFISAVVNFLLLALVLFIVIKTMNRMNEAVSALRKKEKEAEEKEKAEKPTKEEVLLTEIRDLLQAK